MNQTVVIGVGSLMVGLLGSLLGLGGMRLKEAMADIEALQKQVAAAKVEEVDTHQAVPRKNVLTDFNPTVDSPQLARSAYLDPQAAIIGAVEMGARVYVGPFASLRGDEGQPIHIGDDSNVQDGVVIHALEVEQDGKPVEGRTYEVAGKQYAVYVGNRVSLAHQALVHGPARIDDATFVGMQAMVFKSWIGAGCVIEPAAKVIGVVVPPGRYVPAGAVITSQEQADELPSITPDYGYRSLNDAVVHVNTSFSSGYRGQWPVGKGGKGGKHKADHGGPPAEEAITPSHMGEEGHGEEGHGAHGDPALEGTGHLRTDEAPPAAHGEEAHPTHEPEGATPNEEPPVGAHDEGHH